MLKQNFKRIGCAKARSNTKRLIEAAVCRWFHITHKKTPVFESLFNKVPLKFFIKKRLQRRYFPVNIAKCLRTAFVIDHQQLLSTWRWVSDKKISTRTILGNKINFFCLSCLILLFKQKLYSKKKRYCCISRYKGNAKSIFLQKTGRENSY